jgi:hypothetical protein
MLLAKVIDEPLPRLNLMVFFISVGFYYYWRVEAKRPLPR